MSITVWTAFPDVLSQINNWTTWQPLKNTFDSLILISTIHWSVIRCTGFYHSVIMLLLSLDFKQDNSISVEGSIRLPYLFSATLQGNIKRRKLQEGAVPQVTLISDQNPSPFPSFLTFCRCPSFIPFILHSHQSVHFARCWHVLKLNSSAYSDEGSSQM